MVLRRLFVRDGWIPLRPAVPGGEIRTGSVDARISLKPHGSAAVSPKACLLRGLT